MIEFLKKVGVGKNKWKDLSYEESLTAQREILNKSVNDIQLGFFWGAMRLKHPTVDELSGFLDALKEETNFINTEELFPLDIAVNYDGKNRTIHILPSSIFIATGAGAKIIGHGNENVPSKFGITYHQVLNAMGCEYPKNRENILKALELSGFSFYHQKLYNPKLHLLLPKRRNFYLRTYLNTIEKIINPFKTTKIIIGVNHSNYISKYEELAIYSGFKDVFVVKGLEGGIEPFIDRETKIFTNRAFSLTILSKDRNNNVSISNKNVSLKENALINLSILKNEDNPFREWAILTAGILIVAYGLTEDIKEAINVAEESLKSGVAYENFEIYKSITRK